MSSPCSFRGAREILMTERLRELEARVEALERIVRLPVPLDRHWRGKPPAHAYHREGKYRSRAVSHD
jgi:hypothetical protein